MKHLPLALSVLALPSVALAPSATKIAFSPTEGKFLTKTFEHEMELSLDSMDMLLNGQENPMVPEMDMTVSNAQTLTVTDVYGAVRDGKPMRLTRALDELAWNQETAVHMDMGGQAMDQNQSMTGVSELEGRTVVFTWSEDEGEYTVAYEGEERGDAELIEGLTEDMDLRALLPKGEVEPGATWEIPKDALMTILVPGGDMKILPEDSDSEGFMEMGSGPGLGGSMSDMIGELLEGSGKATFEEVREVDGVRCAVIRLTVTIEGAKDLTEMAQAMMEEQELPPELEEMSFDHLDVELEYDAEGTLLWNLAAQHFQTFELSGEVRMVLDQALSVTAQGQTMDIENNLELSGTMGITARAE